MRLLRPRIFISYAREDTSLATAIRHLLEARGFAVFVDTEGTLGGEDFIHRIKDELRGADAVVALLTDASVRSEWCQAEWYFAHAKGVTVIPIRIGDVETSLPAPIRLLEERTHFLSATDAEQQKVSATLADQLDHVRRSRRRKALMKAAAATAVLAALAALSFSITRGVERIAHARERNRVISRVTAVAHPLPGQEIARYGSQFAGDDVLLATMLRLASEPEQSDAARINAMTLGGDLLRRRKAEERWALRDLTWRNGVISGTAVVNTTFVSGVVERLAVERATLAGVVWGRQLTLSNASFRNVKFHGGGFYGTNAIRLDFLACLFYGVELDVTGFALARFRSVPADPQHPNVINAGELCAFENSTIVNRSEPPAAGVLDLSTPADEVQFQDVVFTGVQFRGYIRPEWFRDCTFDRCVLPESLTHEALQARGNRVTDSVHLDQPIG